MGSLIVVMITIDPGPRVEPGSTPHAELIGIVRRALEGSTEMAERFGGALVGLVAEGQEPSDPYRSAFRVPARVE